MVSVGEAAGAVDAGTLSIVDYCLASSLCNAVTPGEGSGTFEDEACSHSVSCEVVY